MVRARMLLGAVILSLAMLAPQPAMALGPMCAGHWAEDQPVKTCAFTYAGGELFVAGSALPRIRQMTPASPMGPEMIVVADVMTDPNDENSILLRCADAPGVLPGGVAFPAACADGAPSVGVPDGITLYCRGRGTTHGFFGCVSNSL